MSLGLSLQADPQHQVFSYSWASLEGLLGEAASLLLLRVLACRRAVPPSITFPAIDKEGHLCTTTYVRPWGARVADTRMTGGHRVILCPYSAPWACGSSRWAQHKWKCWWWREPCMLPRAFRWCGTTASSPAGTVPAWGGADLGVGIRMEELSVDALLQAFGSAGAGGVPDGCCAAGCTCSQRHGCRVPASLPKAAAGLGGGRPAVLLVLGQEGEGGGLGMRDMRLCCSSAGFPLGRGIAPPNPLQRQGKTQAPHQLGTGTTLSSTLQEELRASHSTYIQQHPELFALLADFLQALLLRQPPDPILFAAEFFAPFARHQPPGPSFASSVSPSPFCSISCPSPLAQGD